MNENAKPWFQSIGVLGSTAAILSFVANLVGVTISPADQAQIGVLWTQGVQLATQLVGFVGAVLALWGRLRATTRIG